MIESTERSGGKGEGEEGGGKGRREREGMELCDVWCERNEPVLVELEDG